MSNVISYHLKIAKELRLNEWTKKLGQQHFSVPNTPTTICGKPMLSNNYASVYSQEDKTPCPECEENMAFRLDCLNQDI